jgi:hypothetical protein
MAAAGNDIEWDQIIQACKESWTTHYLEPTGFANGRVDSGPSYAEYLPGTVYDQMTSRPTPFSASAYLGTLEVSSEHNVSASPAPVGSARVSPSLHLRGPDSFHAFVQRIVYLFEQQRRRGQYQFAVLFLSALPIQDINARNMIFQTQRGVVRAPNDASNSEHLRFPPDDMLCNYMTARPVGDCHAEVRLMKDFETLLSIYNSLKMPSYRSVVLYTWLLPCHNCADCMIQKLQEYIIDCAFEVTVIYTSKQRDLKDEEIVPILNRFEVAGIEVLYVPFDQLLKRFLSLEQGWPARL